ncbi:putative transposase [Trichonephila clavipes]|nr:putative transposase [Trichonephila clavipes]
MCLFLFPKSKNHLNGHHFGTLENIQTAVTDQRKAIPISEFHQSYEEWKNRLQRCVASEDNCFEGDNVEFGRDMGSLISVDTTLTGDMYVSLLSPHLHPFMSIVHPGGLGEFKQDNRTPHMSRIAAE